MDIEQVTNRSATPVLKSIIFILGKSNFSHIKNYYIGYKILKISKLQSTMYLINKSNKSLWYCSALDFSVELIGNSC